MRKTITIQIEKRAIHRNSGSIKNLTPRSVITESTPRKNPWNDLHMYPGCDPEWFAEWEKRIPNAGCACYTNYLKLKERWQPDFSSPDALFVSGVILHNLVNEKLIFEGDTKKSIVSLEEARRIWNRVLD